MSEPRNGEIVVGTEKNENRQANGRSVEIIIVEKVKWIMGTGECGNGFWEKEME